MSQLGHLRLLEAESIHIMREVASEFQRPVMLYSIGKDSSVLLRLAQKAVHAGMAGKTGMLIGQWHSTFVHIPFELVTDGP